MSSQREHHSSASTSLLRAIPRPLIDLAGVALAIALVIVAWNDTGAATGEVPMRVFLVGFAIAASVIWVGSSFAGPQSSRHGRSVSRSVVPPSVQHLVMGIVIGLAVGTTDWTSLQLAGWWQFWWTAPLLLAYVSLLVIRRRASGSRP